MTLVFAKEKIRDFTSGEVHRFTPAALTLLLRVAIVSLIVAAFAPHIPFVDEVVAIMGGAFLATITAFLKFTG